MSIFQAPQPVYETMATKTIASVESGCGLLGLWPRPVYLGDTRTSTCGEGSGFLGLGLGGLFASPAPAYVTTPAPPALVAAADSKKKTP